MDETLGKKLSQLRKERGLSQKELAARMLIYGIDVTNQAISKWEKGMTQPTASQFLALCGALDVENISARFMGKREKLFQGLNEAGVRKINEYADILRASGMFSDKQKEPLRVLPLYSMAVSAGTGQFLDSSDYESVQVGNEVSKAADFGVRVAGNSMEPRYVNGQTVWIHSQNTLESGETGILLYDDNVYLKQLFVDNSGIRLHSLNSEYKDIKIGSLGELRVLGKAVS